MPHAEGECWVFHRGALGDSVLLWPLLRDRQCCQPTALVTDGSKARLAARELGIRGIDIEQRRFNDLWLPDAIVEPVPDVKQVIAFTAPATASSHFATNLRSMFPTASIQFIHQRPDAHFARHWSTPPRRGMPPLCSSAGPIICHIGAGAHAKRWPLEHFLALAAALEQTGTDVILIAGEAEAEQLSPDLRAQLERAGGRFIFELAELADLLRTARLIIGNDSGPAHLGAQLGIPVLALFGPTDPGQWGPVGPAVHVLAPPSPCPINWLDVATVLNAARAAGTERSPARPAINT